MSKDNFNFFINDIKYIINFSVKSMFNHYNYKENENKKIISGISNYYIKFIFNLNDQLEAERILNDDLYEQLEQERILNDDLYEQLEEHRITINNLKSKRDIKCSICFENDLSICCIPCGHTYCYKCIINSKNCFICRTAIIRTNKIYL